MQAFKEFMGKFKLENLLKIMGNEMIALIIYKTHWRAAACSCN